MSDTIRVSEKTYELLKGLKEKEGLKSFDAAIRVVLERGVRKKRDKREVKALAEAVRNFRTDVDTSGERVEEVSF